MMGQPQDMKDTCHIVAAMLLPVTLTMWMPNSGLYQSSLTWHFSCTADYAYLWFEHDGGRSGFHNNFAGVSELQSVPASYLGTGNAFFPAVGFYSGSNNGSYYFGTSSTNSYHDYFTHSLHGSWPNGDDGPYDYVNANNIQYTGHGGIHRQRRANGSWALGITTTHPITIVPVIIISLFLMVMDLK